MKYGLIKAAACGFEVTVADPMKNSEQIVKKVKQAYQKGAKIIVFPELSITGYTCGDLFWHRALLEDAHRAIESVLRATCDWEIVVAVGAPFAWHNELYNCAFLLYKGEILGIVPKQNIPNYAEFYEARTFSAGQQDVRTVLFRGREVPFGGNLLFCCDTMPAFKIAAEICEDMWVTPQPGGNHTSAGATVLINLSASNEVVGKKEYRRNLVKSFSGRAVCGYVYADAGYGESTTDLVFAGHHMIAENGKILAESQLFEDTIIYGVLDVDRIENERRKMNTYSQNHGQYVSVTFSMKLEKTELGTIKPYPFVPSDQRALEQRCEEILNIQAYGLKKRLEHTHAKTAVIGISGGLDSTLALLVTKRAFRLLGKDSKEIIAVTMPCFGTTDRTYQNAVKMIRALGATFREVKIQDSVRLHFRDIGQSENSHDVTYENSQARERTQVLMDIANMENGLVVGTGDMSELALGWATYNGDHMSMYGVNSSVPKTLVKFLVKYYADTTDDRLLSSILYDIIDTPVSPELLPPENGEIAQKTEDLVGPYELHDFFLYYFLRFQFEPRKILHFAVHAFQGTYDEATIKKWLAVFLKRFFSQQFKRSCIPDGPKVGTVSLSPRGDLRMPSDAVCRLWLDDLS